jgi:23S rRNA (pseudouridine1915-N3)-methyltransferase
MRLLLIRAGRFQAPGARELAGVWLDHARRYARVEVLEAEGPARRRARTDEERRGAEEALLLRAVPAGATLVAADSRGREVDSPWFASCIDHARNAGRDLAFLVGGASGLSDAVRARADHVVAFGRITLNHDLAVVVLAEQIWRGLAILHGHPYHAGHV